MLLIWIVVALKAPFRVGLRADNFTFFPNPPLAAGDFLFALPADRTQARTDAYAEAKSGSQGSDRPTADALSVPALSAWLGAQGPHARHSTL